MAGADGTTVVNFAQWENEESVRNMMADPAVPARMAPAWELATPTALRYSIASVHRP